MRKNINNNSPKVGDKRIREEFLILPQSINGEQRWLEWAKWEEVYAEGFEVDFGGMERVGYWEMVKWINK